MSLPRSKTTAILRDLYFAKLGETRSQRTWDRTVVSLELEDPVLTHNRRRALICALAEIRRERPCSPGNRAYVESYLDFKRNWQFLVEISQVVGQEMTMTGTQIYEKFCQYRLVHLTTIQRWCRGSSYKICFALGKNYSGCQLRNIWLVLILHLWEQSRSDAASFSPPFELIRELTQAS